MSIMRKSIMGLLAAGMLSVWGMPDDAFAQAALSSGCATLAQNQAWNDGIMALRVGVETKDYDAALKAAAPLTSICGESPILNYYVGLAMQGSGDDVKALIYFQKASQHMSDFTVPPEISRRIWYARYEGEYPERTEDAVLRRAEENKRLTAQSTDLTEKLAQAERTIENLNLSHKVTIDQMHAEAKSRYAATMWTGVGVGIAGILVGVGGGLLAYFSSNNEAAAITPQYISGLAMLGGGIGMTLAGAIVAGIGGYQYTHVGLEDTVTDDVSVSFNFTGTGATFGMTF